MSSTKTLYSFVFIFLFLISFSYNVYATGTNSSGVDSGDTTEVTTADETNNSNTDITTDDTKKNVVETSTDKKFVLQISAAKAKSVTLKWNKVSGAKNYYVYRSTKKTSGYKKIATVKASKRKYINNNLIESKNYYYKVKAVCNDGKKITSNVKVKVKVKGDYSRGSVYGPSLTTSQLNKVKDYVANFVNVYTTPDMDDFEKVMYAHGYLCDNCSYETRGWNVNYANTAYGALKYKKAQCSGYARAFKALCDGMGIGCRYVHANSKAMNPSHQWNFVKVDKKWYLIDVQLNDSSTYWFSFLLGKNSIDQMDNVYKYDTKGMPKLSKKDYDYSKYLIDD